MPDRASEKAPPFGAEQDERDRETEFLEDAVDSGRYDHEEDW